MYSDRFQHQSMEIHKNMYAIGQYRYAFCSSSPYERETCPLFQISVTCVARQTGERFTDGILTLGAHVPVGLLVGVVSEGGVVFATRVVDGAHIKVEMKFGIGYEPQVFRSFDSWRDQVIIRLA